MPSLKYIITPTLMSLLLSATAFAAPAPPSPTEQGIYNVGEEAVYTPTLGGAAAVVTAKVDFHIDVDIANPPKYLSITVVNKHTVAITTAHAVAAGAPTAVSGAVGAGTMAKGATAVFAVPTGWIGNIAINEYPKNIVGDESLIESNFVKPDNYKVAVADVDVSYVDGFSVPILCSCTDSGVVTGCNKNLWSLNSCPNNNGQGSCKNPLRAVEAATAPTTFFSPCRGAAYTFVTDHGANSFGVCQSGHISCCVGTACPASPKQPK